MRGGQREAIPKHPMLTPKRSFTLTPTACTQTGDTMREGQREAEHRLTAVSHFDLAQRR